MDDTMINQALDWDDEISAENEFELLPEGEYKFRIETLERGRFNGSAKMAACPQANLTIAVTKEDGKEAKVFDTLYLNTKAEWRLSQFFVAIGQKKKGEPLTMNWKKVPGSTGKLKLVINEYTDKNGNARQNNRIDRYLEPENKVFTPGHF